MAATTKTSSKRTVTIDKEEYEALVHTTKVTSEYLDGKVQSFDSADELIASLKSL